jgi:precorrin-4/cobalt-precorrin-4 C11-methyltransferase
MTEKTGNENRKTENQVYFLGSGPGDPELLTLKGKRILGQADLVVHAGSLVDPALLDFCRQAELVDSASLDLEQIVTVMVEAWRAGRKVVRLHSGDPSLFGAIKEQIACLRQEDVPFAVIPGVTSLSAAAAALASELTVPEISQTVIITRAAGRTPVPEREEIRRLAIHRATMAVFLSAALVKNLQEQLLEGYPPETPVVVVQHASRPDQLILRATVASFADEVEAAGIDRTAIILVGDTLAQEGEESRLYDRGFSHGYRDAE